MSLKVTDLRVYYRSLAGDVKALDGATFSIADKEIMGLAGESGCGKSTLGNSLIRLDGRMKYVAGSVNLDGTELPIWDKAGMNEFRYRDVSVIPQYAMSAMNPTRKIGVMTQELLESRGENFTQIKPELLRRIDLVGLQRSVLARYPIELSGGMKQRMVMVISTLLNPSLLIADEIVITHDVSILYQTADTILIMYAGKLAEKAPTATIIEGPRHPYTKMLISSLPEVGVRYANKKLTGIPGSPPALLHPPTGCRFRARCPLAYEKCLEEPPFKEIARDHTVACWKVTGSDA